MKLLKLIFSLLLLVMVAGCSEEELFFYEEIEDEKIVLELEDEPAFIVGYIPYSNKMFVQMSYSQYAGEYYASAQRDTFFTDVVSDIMDKSFGVEAKKLNKYQVPFDYLYEVTNNPVTLYSVYVTASITNNRVIDKDAFNAWDGLDYGFDSLSYPKAFLQELRKR